MEVCEICNKQINKNRYNFHLKSKSHLKNEMKMKKSTEKVEQEDENDVNEERDEDEIDENEEQEQTQYNLHRLMNICLILITFHSKFKKKINQKRLNKTNH